MLFCVSKIDPFHLALDTYLRKIANDPTPNESPLQKDEHFKYEQQILHPPLPYILDISLGLMADMHYIFDRFILNRVENYKKRNEW